MHWEYATIGQIQWPLEGCASSRHNTTCRRERETGDNTQTGRERDDNTQLGRERDGYIREGESSLKVTERDRLTQGSKSKWELCEKEFLCTLLGPHGASQWMPAACKRQFAAGQTSWVSRGQMTRTRWYHMGWDGLLNLHLQLQLRLRLQY